MIFRKHTPKGASSSALSDEAFIAFMDRAIEDLHAQIQTSFGLNVQIGFEWEFRVHDTSKLRADHPIALDVFNTDMAERCASFPEYREMKEELLPVHASGAGVTSNQYELVTNPTHPLAAARALEGMKTVVKDYVDEKGFKLTSRGFEPDKITNALHVCSCITDGDGKIVTMCSNDPVDKNDHFRPITGPKLQRANGLTIKYIKGTMEILQETPLWAVAHPGSFQRFTESNVDPHEYSVGDVGFRRMKALSIRKTTGPGEYGEGRVPCYVENRVPDAEMDPRIAVFQTLLSVYHSLQQYGYEKSDRGLMDRIRYGEFRDPLPVTMDEARDAQQHGHWLPHYVRTGVVSQDVVNAIDQRATQLRESPSTGVGLLSP